MEKPKIEEISSIEYDLGRIDKFSIYEKIDIHKELINFIYELGFNQEALDEFDFDFTKFEGYKFAYSKNMRIHLILNDNQISFILDTNLSKEEIIAKLERYFKILE